jgi:hypothetical protein
MRYKESKQKRIIHKNILDIGFNPGEASNIENTYFILYPKGAVVGAPAISYGYLNRAKVHFIKQGILNKLESDNSQGSYVAGTVNVIKIS